MAREGMFNLIISLSYYWTGNWGDRGGALNILREPQAVESNDWGLRFQGG